MSRRFQVIPMLDFSLLVALKLSAPYAAPVGPRIVG